MPEQQQAFGRMVEVYTSHWERQFGTARARAPAHRPWQAAATAPVREVSPAKWERWLEFSVHTFSVNPALVIVDTRGMNQWMETKSVPRKLKRKFMNTWD